MLSKDYPIIVTKWLPNLSDLDGIIADMKKETCKCSGKSVTPAGFIVAETHDGFILCRKLLPEDRQDESFMERLGKQNCDLGLKKRHIVLQWEPEV